MTRLLALLLTLAAGAAVAQETTETGTGALLRGLDKLNGRATDLEVRSGNSTEFGRIEITVEDCRYPQGNRAGEAFAFLTVREMGTAEPVFRGWMIASSPALNPMDHQRYDVWVIRCTNS
ncbi:DUF2155 domain-containing protein [Salipiger marinus]|mgnify:FL=1|jgi:hypothetical protein|uniref:DUF2155 domain-containing protein n=1 Tax=Salipiger marinus TaxID=555512 RepID=UPI000E965A0B|nr:DUF2155 domain-containing protein [Salipiger manganoxidans]MCD1619648.1 DUF2155 domain-containing protein [Salipiger manganoxidans]MEB3420502.1 DUF2155 domain-containing protein [Salipiger manganoxidans]HBM58242.1 DUF2155 domain-containing protein [Citreicella sp.]HBS98480.1 DUF2155 domain-containing protein [Citreicella sp.]|tara:strand:+ start:1011 stop:1370 length:360 start_codon:yes stop_codon:yes gene_type:complete